MGSRGAFRYLNKELTGACATFKYLTEKVLVYVVLSGT